MLRAFFVKGEFINSEMHTSYVLCLMSSDKCRHLCGIGPTPLPFPGQGTKHCHHSRKLAPLCPFPVNTYSTSNCKQLSSDSFHQSLGIVFYRISCKLYHAGCAGLFPLVWL